jgi:propionyl-CoA synthetase
VPVIDHWWQTETGWPIARTRWGSSMLPVKLARPRVPMPGYDVQVLDDAGHDGAAELLEVQAGDLFVERLGRM